MKDIVEARPEVPRRRQYRPSAPQEEFIVPLLRERIQAAIARYGAPAPIGAEALDVGCGEQPFRIYLEQRGYRYHSLDVQQNRQNNVEFLGAIDQPLPPSLVDRRFQFILCTEVLEHVADWNVAFENLQRLAASSARILITCPHFYQLHETPHDFWRPTLHAIQYFATRNGFCFLHQEAAGDAWDVLGTLIANCCPEPANSEFSSRLLGTVAKRAWPYLFRLIRKRVLQKKVLLRGPLYLANVVVLEKP